MLFLSKLSCEAAASGGTFTSYASPAEMSNTSCSHRPVGVIHHHRVLKRLAKLNSDQKRIEDTDAATANRRVEMRMTTSPAVKALVTPPLYSESPRIPPGRMSAWRAHDQSGLEANVVRFFPAARR